MECEKSETAENRTGTILGSWHETDSQGSLSDQGLCRCSVVVTCQILWFYTEGKKYKVGFFFETKESCGKI